MEKLLEKTTQLKDQTRFRANFPFFENNPGAIYLDSAATALKLRPVIEAEKAYYEEYSANVHRSFHSFGERSTFEYESARKQLGKFIHARSEKEIIFTSGTTASINTISNVFKLKEGSTILLSEMEHHSNLIPWQLAAKRAGAKLKFIPFTPSGELDLSDLENLLTPGVALVSVTHASNVFGTINNIKLIIAAAHAVGAKVLIDGAQAVAHIPVDVADLDCDFYAFSGHKLFGPTGTGVLYGKETLLENLPPFMGGGDMISSVWLDHAKWNDLPYKFEAGTPNIAGFIGLGKSAEFLNRIGMDTIESTANEVIRYFIDNLRQFEKVTIYGESSNRTGAVSFSIEGVHPHDIAQYLSSKNIAIRAGHHCAQPIMRKLGVPALARASLSAYNTKEEVDRFLWAIIELKEYFKV